MSRSLLLFPPAIALALLAGCATTAQGTPPTMAQAPATQVPTGGEAKDAPSTASDTASPPRPPVDPDEPALPEPARARFESEKIEVVATSRGEDGYVLKDGLGEVSEGAFLDRYRRVTGASDAPASSAGGTVPIVLGGVVLAAGLVGAAVVLSSSQGSSSCTPMLSYCAPNTSSSNLEPSSTASLLLLGTGVVGATLVGVGIAANHHAQSLTRAEAERLCGEYNRALRRKIAREDTATP